MKRGFLVVAIGITISILIVAIFLKFRTVFWTEIAATWAMAIGVMSAAWAAGAVAFLMWRRDGFRRLQALDDARILRIKDKEKSQKFAISAFHAYASVKGLLEEATVGLNARVMVQYFKTALTSAHESINEALATTFAIEPLLTDALNFRVAIISMQRDIDKYPDFAVPGDFSKYLKRWLEELKPAIEAAEKRLTDAFPHEQEHLSNQ